jgi:hypothetical protein
VLSSDPDLGPESFVLVSEGRSIGLEPFVLVSRGGGIRVEPLVFVSRVRCERLQFVAYCASTIEVGVDSLDLSGESRNLSLGVLDFGLSLATRGVNLLLGLRPELLEAGSKRANLNVRGTFQFFPMLLCRHANLSELPFRFPPDLRRDLLGCGSDGSLLLLRSRTEDLLSKVVQLGFEVLAQASRRAVKRRSDLIVERHCLESTDYTVSHGKYLQQLSFESLPEAHTHAESRSPEGAPHMNRTVRPRTLRSHGVLVLAS